MSDLSGFVTWIPDKILDAVVGRRRVRLLMHEAVFHRSMELCYFLNVTNLSHDREVEFTHVWIEASGVQIHALNPERPLPKRLKPDETWETWIPVALVPLDPDGDVFKSGRVRLSTGTVVDSQKNDNVPHIGYVPGGQAPPDASGM